ncbi:MAG: lactonase family protein, partial [Gorillibacterium sp.]|nr:lactonase family protein [Gorillibacterium sp.]
IHQNVDGPLGKMAEGNQHVDGRLGKSDGNQHVGGHLGKSDGNQHVDGPLGKSDGNLHVDGRLGEIKDGQQHVGSSPHPAQNQARCHSATFDANNRFAIVCDLGLDKIISYQLDTVADKLVARSEIKLALGSGPRHFVFHPYLPFAYVINELNSTITGFSYEEESGLLTERQTISTLPASFTEDNACADIHISPDGQFLYGSNRGHDSLAVYAIDSTEGTLTLVEHAPTLGGHPRNFALSPDGRFVWVANRDSNNVVTFSRDADTGKLHPTGHELSISKPVCIQLM